MSRRPTRRGPPAKRNRSRAPAPSQPRLLPETLTVERLSHDGRGIARWQGKTLFVAGALAGERVQVRLLNEQSRFGEGEVASLVTEAPERQAPPCPHYAECGGCQLQHMYPAAQLAAKQAALLEQLRRAGATAARELAPALESSAEGYRQRARLGVWYERDGRVILGFRRRRRKELTPIDHCLVLVPELNALLGPLHQWLSALQRRAAITHVELLCDEHGPALVVRETRPLTPEDLDRLRQLEIHTGCRAWRQTGNDTGLLDSQSEPVDPRLYYGLPEFSVALGFHPSDFTQVNASVNRQMVSRALAWLAPQPGEKVLDLFCGMGNFTLPLARSGAEVLGLEASRSMVERGRENAERNGLPNAGFDRSNLSDFAPGPWLAQLGRVDALLLDPPREGARQLLAGIGQLSPQRLVYVSCNPATLARDAVELQTAGYDLHLLSVLDMFPHTEHVESMALFVRR